MTNRLFRFSYTIFLIIISGQAIAQISYDNWNTLIRAQNSVLVDSLATFGIRPDATPDFDNAYDVPRPPRAPSGNYLEVYFPHSGGNYPAILGSKYATDYQGPSDPAWNFSVEASLGGQVTLTWDSIYVNSIEPRVKLLLYDVVNGSFTNMRQQGSYTFVYSVKRNFQIVGAISINLKYLMEGFWNGTTQIQDTVDCLLALPESPFTPVDSVRCYLSSAGTGQLIFTRSASGNYYLVVRHRNHIEIWSSIALGVVKGTTSISSYDFSSGSAYGTNALKQAGSVFVSWGGDVNQDGVVDFIDRNITWNHRGETGYRQSDCNGDNITGTDDYDIVMNNRYKIKQKP